MERVLHIVNQMNRQDHETFLMDVYRLIDRSRLQFDFVETLPETAAYDDEIRDLGGRIFHVARRPEKRGRQNSRYAALSELVRKGGFRIVHVHGSDAMSMARDLQAAKAGGAIVLISHARTFRSGFQVDENGTRALTANVDRQVRQQVFRPILYRLAGWHLCCSEEAGEWLYGNRHYEVIPYGVNTDELIYRPDVRREVREELGLGDRLVVGHVGKLTALKNHAFLLRVFQALTERRPDACLLLVGSGELRQDLEAAAATAGISEQVYFLGVRSDVPRLLQAMDVMIFPSIAEGLPVQLIEAQAAGLPCLVSTHVTRDIAITPLVDFISLESPPNVWAQRALYFVSQPRREESAAIREAGYDSRQVSERLEQLYLSV